MQQSENITHKERHTRALNGLPMVSNSSLASTTQSKYIYLSKNNLNKWPMFC